MPGELIYCGYKQYETCVDELTAKYPNAQIEDASDDIHGGRFEITVSDVDEDEFNMFLLEKGYLDISLNLLLYKYSNPEYLKKLIKRIILERENKEQEVIEGGKEG